MLNYSSEELKKQLTELLNLKRESDDIIYNLTAKRDLISNQYFEIMRNNSYKDITFGLDSLTFQRMIINKNYDHLTDSIKIITNRIYGDYFRLYNIIIKLTESKASLKKFLENSKKTIKHQSYKDLEIRKQYTESDINIIFSDIVDTIHISYQHLNNINESLDVYKDKLKFGLNIDNFINSLEDNTLVVINKLNLFSRYVYSLCNFHKKYLNNFLKKAKIFLDDITKELQFDEKVSVDVDKLDKSLISKRDIGEKYDYNEMIEDNQNDNQNNNQNDNQNDNQNVDCGRKVSIIIEKENTESDKNSISNELDEILESKEEETDIKEEETDIERQDRIDKITNMVLDMQQNV